MNTVGDYLTLHSISPRPPPPHSHSDGGLGISLIIFLLISLFFYFKNLETSKMRDTINVCTLKVH